MKRLILAASALAALSGIAEAKSIVISTDSKVFESPVARDEYCAVNDSDDPITLLTGMAFQVKEEKAGWYVIEYSPGLRGMVMTNVISNIKNLSIPSPGKYKVINNPGELIEIVQNGDTYSLKSGQKDFKGYAEDNIIIFYNADGQQVYSATILNKQPAIYNYDNSITRFF